MNVLFALGGVLIAEGGEHAALLLEVGSASPDHGCCIQLFVVLGGRLALICCFEVSRVWRDITT